MSVTAFGECTASETGKCTACSECTASGECTSSGACTTSGDCVMPLASVLLLVSVTASREHTATETMVCPTLYRLGQTHRRAGQTTHQHGYIQQVASEPGVGDLGCEITLLKEA